MEWHRLLSYLCTNELRLFLGIWMIVRWLNCSIRRKELTGLAAGGVFITFLQEVSGSLVAPVVVEWIMVAATVWKRKQEKWNICFFLVFMYEMAVGMWEFLIHSWMGVILHSSKFINQDTPQYLFCIWLVRLGTAAVFSFMGRKKQERILSVFVLLGFLGTVSLSQQTVLSLNEECIDVWLFLSIVLICSVLFYRINLQREMEEEIVRLKQQQVEILQRDYETLKHTYSDHAQLYHDLHHHIEAIYQCLVQGNIEAAEKYCEKLRTPVRRIAQTVWTGDTAVDYLISSKIEQARQCQIRTEVQIEYPHNTDISSVDLVTILGNLLDNALEGAQTASGDLRYLSLTVRRIHFMLVIKTENGYGKNPIKNADGLITAKEDKMLHGWGLKSIQTAAECYDGVVHTSYENGIFQAVVTLSFCPVQTEE